MKVTTLVFLLDGERVLLAMKKRGFGTGKFNGVGGKVQEGEDVLTAAIRETTEEIGVSIDPTHLERVAVIDFAFEENPSWDQQTHVFITSRWQGEPGESEEMAPQWFTRDSLPFDRMWVDDPHWLPHILAGEKVAASFVFAGGGGEIREYSVAPIDNLT